MISGKDFLRQALGQVQYVIDREKPVDETTLSKIRKDPNRERILKVFSQLQRSITWWGGDNQMIVFKDSFSDEDKDLRGYNTQRPDIRTAKIDAEITKVFVKLKSLSIASPDALISLTAGFPSILSIINS